VEHCLSALFDALNIADTTAFKLAQNWSKLACITSVLAHYFCIQPQYFCFQSHYFYIQPVPIITTAMSSPENGNGTQYKGIETNSCTQYKKVAMAYSSS
jgi:hypothetical protein